MNNIVGFLNKSIGVYDIRGIQVEPTVWEALAIIFLLFLLVLTLARLRFLYIHWNLGKSSLSFLFYGFLLALILEGFMVLSGRTFLTQTLGWKNPPKPVSTALDIERQKLINVLGVESQIPNSVAKENPTFQSVVTDFKNLSTEDSQLVKEYLCRP